VQAPRIVSPALPIASFSLSKPARCSAVGWVRALDALDHQLAHASAIAAAEVPHAERPHHRAALHHARHHALRPPKRRPMPVRAAVLVIAAVAPRLRSGAGAGRVLVVRVAAPGPPRQPGTAFRSGLRSGAFAEDCLLAVVAARWRELRTAAAATSRPRTALA
jgi:hypothetical protein